jgi:hypothetical protein
MTLDFRRGGRKVSQQEFMKGIKADALEMALKHAEDTYHGLAASVVDPETGKHAAVMLRRTGNKTMTIFTSGSPAFARALEERLGVGKGEVYSMSEPAKRERLVYLAHAWEDKAIMEPIAQGLMARGINVWYDKWEISVGDSLRQKMEAGLGDCTHFIVLLTPKSIEKAWVKEEIDAGLLSHVEGSAKFMGLRVELPISKLSIFLRTRLTPEFMPGEAGLDDLRDQIFEVSRKPPLGEKPRYVQQHDPGSTWSVSARCVAEYFVRNSDHGDTYQPQVGWAGISQATGLSLSSVRIGCLDLCGAGLLEKHQFVGEEPYYTPQRDLFVTFDGMFMPWNPEEDARVLASHLSNTGNDQADPSEMGSELGWEPRRFNPAMAYLVSARIVKAHEAVGGATNYWPAFITMGDELLRYVHSLD